MPMLSGRTRPRIERLCLDAMLRISAKRNNDFKCCAGK
ncbi:hypothetical protein roselon_00183 [Roseibacterium elongatum DSM 19469]|uniref:Uncharacterized protein n=1 Tax=Roseicyclus elongatus DSM 19469 TaxID=1294273 RepID=W8SJF7_9RHOB|nr:hypothetical protein roselon_00183 [Roseibacterium elongatum DSM 19469]